MQLLERRPLASLAAAAEVFPLAGRQIEIAPFSGYLEVGVEGPAAAGVTYNVTVGGRQVVLGNQARQGAAAVAIPGGLDVLNEEVIAGERITLQIVNGSGAAASTFIHVRLSTQPRTS